MKVTHTQLKRIIKEEMSKILDEAQPDPAEQLLSQILGPTLSTMVKRLIQEPALARDAKFVKLLMRSAPKQ